MGTANSQLVVNIPVIASSKNIIIPGLWVKNNNITDIGNDKVNGSILINACPPPPGTDDDELADLVGVNSDNVLYPSTQKVVPHIVTFPEAPALPPPNVDGSASYYTITGNPFGKDFPRTPLAVAVADVPAKDGYYHYLVDDLVNNGGGTINIAPGKKVIFYVKGNIDLGGNPDINPTASNTATQLQIYGNTYTSILSRLN